MASASSQSSGQSIVEVTGIIGSVWETSERAVSGVSRPQIRIPVALPYLDQDTTRLAHGRDG